VVDAMIMGSQSWKNILAIKACLHLFEAVVSGLKVNFQKESIKRNQGIK